MAIQDLNKIEGSETKLNNVSKNMVKLKKNIISECHYMDELTDEWSNFFEIQPCKARM